MAKAQDRPGFCYRLQKIVLLARLVETVCEFVYVTSYAGTLACPLCHGVVQLLQALGLTRRKEENVSEEDELAGGYSCLHPYDVMANK